MLSDSFLHSSFPLLEVLLKSISQPFHSHPNIPSLVKNSAQGFQTPSPLVTVGLLNGQMISLLQSTTRVLWGALSCRRMKRLLFLHHHHHHHYYHTLLPRMSATLKQDIVFQVHLSLKKDLLGRLELLMPVSVLMGSIFWSYLEEYHLTMQ